MMGTYFGTPTPNWGSGTEEEFRIAFESHKANGFPDIMFYFSNAVTSLRDVDAEQLAKVSAFRKELGELGVYYWQYDDQTGLMLDLHRQLTQSIIEITRDKETGAEIGAAPDQSALLLPNYETLIAENARVAVELLVERAVQHLESHTSCLKDITKSAELLTRKIGSATRKLNNAAKQGKVKLAENAHLEFFDALKSYRKDLFRLIPKMRSEFEASMLSLQRALLIRRENGLEQEVPDEGVFDGARGMLDSLLSLREIVISTNAVFESQFTSLPVFSTQSEIIAALHKDITVYVDSVERLVKKFCEDFE
ncbi:hypothetical protein CEW89_08970 [Celeribacter ethanolicus]|uniref:Uncharacterized protein n=2 Tax=Celeribacter ethanolicus TaxID=1758178 RepID=A0A291GBW5_9RHOB|nr:hypothetical protein CEW89_08970 [Celeribacter ethanolicus]